MKNSDRIAKLSRKLMAIIVLVMGLMIVLCGCSKEDAEHETWILVSCANNQAEIDMTSAKEEILKSCEIGENKIYLLSIEGKPVVAKTYVVPKQSSLLLPSQKKKNAELIVSEIVGDLYEIVPTSAEVDYGKALSIVDTASNKAANIDLIIIGSGISTTGCLNFKNGFEPEDAIERIKEEDALMDFSNIRSVYFTGVGQVINPQDDLTPAAYNNVVATYTGLFEIAGVDPSSIRIESGVRKLSNTNKKEKPPVSSVDIPDNKISDVNVFNDCVFGSFEPDTSNFINTKQAETAANAIADQLKTNNKKYIVAGFTAGDVDNESTIELSKKRAEAVCDLLEKAGVERKRLYPLGCGAGIKTDYTERGIGTGIEAQQNRKTILIEWNSDEGKDILAKYQK